MDHPGFGSTVCNSYANQQILRSGFGVFGKDIEIAISAEDSSIFEFVFRTGDAAMPVFLDKPLIRELPLGIFVKRLGVGIGRSGVEIIIVLLHVLAMVTFWPGETEQTLFQNRITPIP
jgi:hypothetical protein